MRKIILVLSLLLASVSTAAAPNSVNITYIGTLPNLKYTTKVYKLDGKYETCYMVYSVPQGTTSISCVR